jgi:hypothetical protein
MHSLMFLTAVLTPFGQLKLRKPEEEANILESLEGIRSKQLDILDIRGLPLELEQAVRTTT